MVLKLGFSFQNYSSGYETKAKQCVLLVISLFYFLLTLFRLRLCTLLKEERCLLESTLQAGDFYVSGIRKGLLNGHGVFYFIFGLLIIIIIGCWIYQ